MSYEQYYDSLNKPFFAPPNDVFGVIWPILYVIIVISFGWVFFQVLILKRWRVRLLIPFLINIVANALYSPLFFNLQKPLLATLDILVVLGSIIWIILCTWKKAKWVSWAQVPYLLWVGFASILQISILIKNWS